MEPGKAEPRGNSQCHEEHCSHAPQPRHTGGQAGNTRLSLKPRGKKNKRCSGNKINYQDNKHSDFRGESDQGLQEPQMSFLRGHSLCQKLTHHHLGSEQ